MIPDHAICEDPEGDLWRCIDGRWYCVTQQDTHGVTADVMLTECGPLDVHIWRDRIETKETK